MGPDALDDQIRRMVAGMHLAGSRPRALLTRLASREPRRQGLRRHLPGDGCRQGRLPHGLRTWQRQRLTSLPPFGFCAQEFKAALIAFGIKAKSSEVLLALGPAPFPHTTAASCR
jgi:hypothetical protein